MLTGAEANDSKLQKTLHYGAHILISLAEDYENPGYIYGDGFITRTITYKKEEAFGTDDSTGAIFKVVPASSYAAQKKLEEKIMKTYSNEQMLSSELQALMDRAERELRQNKNNSKLMNCKPIILGSPIQLLHVKSHKFLSFQLGDQHSSATPDNLNFKLVDNASENTLFKILPSYKFQSEKDKLIKFDDHVYLCSGSENLSRNSFLYVVCKNSLAEPKRSKEILLEETITKHDTDDDEQILIALDKSSKLKLSLFAEAVENEEEVVSFGDIIWLQHIEKDNYLFFDNKKDISHFLQEDRLSSLYKPDENGLYFYHSDTSSEVKNSNGMWKIEILSKFHTERFNWNSNFILRHLSSGLYLTLKAQEGKNNRTVYLEKQPTEDSIFSFCNSDHPAKKLEASNHLLPITLEDMVRVYHVKTKLWLSINDFVSGQNLGIQYENAPSVLSQNIDFIAESKQEDVFRINKVKGTEVWETYILISCYPVFKSATKLVSAINDSVDKKGFYDNLSPSKEYGLNLMKHCIVTILKFLHDESSEVLSMNMLSKPSFSRQKMLKEQGFIKRLVEIIDCCFSTKESLARLKILDDGTVRKRNVANELKISRRTLWQDFQSQYEIENIGTGGEYAAKQRNQVKIVAYLSQICKLIYELLKSLAKENPENEIECFKNIDIFKKQAGHGLGATKCILSIVEKNEKLLYAIHSTEEIEFQSKSTLTLHQSSIISELSDKNSLIHFFCNQLKTGSSAYRRDILKFLSAACTFEDQGITVNQTLIYSLAFSNEQIKGATFLPLRCEDGKIYVNLYPHAMAKYMKAPDVCLDELNKTSGRYDKDIEYLTEQLELFRNLSYGRNYICRQPVVENLPMSALLKNIWTSSISKNIRAALIMVLLSVYIDINPRTALIVPQLTRPIVLTPVLKKGLTRSLTKKVEWRTTEIDSPKNNSSSSLMISEDDLFGSSSETESPTIEVGKDDEKLIVQLKTDILNYFKKDVYKDAEKSNHENSNFLKPKRLEKKKTVNLIQKSVEFDSYLLNLITIAKKMAIFGQYSGDNFVTLYTDSSEQENFNFRVADNNIVRSELAQLVYVLFPVLFVERSGSNHNSKDLLTHKPPLIKSQGSIHLEESDKGSSFFADLYDKVELASKQINKVMSFSPSLGFIPKKTSHNDSHRDTKYFTQQSKLPKGDNEESLIRAKLLKVAESKRENVDHLEMLVRKEILSVLEFALNVRVDFLITNTIQFFVKKVLSIENLSNHESLISKIVVKGDYLPPIMMSDILKPEIEKDELINLDPRLFEDLDKMTGSFSVRNLLYLFVRSKNHELDATILNIIIASFSQRASLIKMLRKTDILFTRPEVDLLNFVSDAIRKLKFLIDQSELWLLSKVRNTKIIDSVTQILCQLIACFYTSTVVDNTKSPPELTGVPTQRTDAQISPVRQSMFHSLEIHKEILRLVKDATFILKSLEEGKGLQSVANIKTINLFQNCYSILSLMCRNNHKKGRKALSKALNIFSLHLPLFQVGQSELICDLYKNSEQSLRISDELTNTFYNIIMQKGHNPAYLQFFDTILGETNPDHLQENVNKIISILKNPERRFEFAFMEYKEKSHQYEFNLNIGEHKDGDYPFVYHARVLEILHKVFELSNNKVLARPVIQNLLPLDSILRILGKNDFWCPETKDYKPDKALLYSLLKIPLIKLLKDIWLEVESKVGYTLAQSKLLFAFLAKETEKMKRFDPKTLYEAIQYQESPENIPQSNNIDIYYYQTHIDPRTAANGASLNKIDINITQQYRYVYNYHVFLLDNMLPVMTRLNLILTTVELEQPTEEKQGLAAMLDFSTSFKNNYYKFQNPLTPDLATTAVCIKSFLDVFQMSESELENRVEDGGENSPLNLRVTKTKEIRNSLLGKFIGEAPSNSSFMRLDATIKNLAYIDEAGEQTKQRLWKSFVLDISLNEEVKTLVQHERNALIRSILNIESFEFEDFKMTSISLESIVRKLILHIETGIETPQSSDSDSESIPGSILLLADLIGGCENNAELRRMQGLLSKCQVVKMACAVLFKDYVKLETKKLMIYFLTKMLQGGNSEMQAAFYHRFISDPESENFFKLIYDLISEEIVKYSKKVSSYQKIEKIMQHWDYTNKFFKFGLSVVLRLVQLFAEGHFQQLQAYFREQTNSKTNYDMISLLVRLNEVLLESLTEEKYQILQQSLETLIEFVQGPCHENQASLANSKFLEFASLILQSDQYRKIKTSFTPHNKMMKIKQKLTFLTRVLGLSGKAAIKNKISVEEAIVTHFTRISVNIGNKIQEKLRKNDPLYVKSWMIDRIKYKIFILVESLLEGAVDDSIITKMTKAFPITILQENMCEIYKTFINSYGKSNYTTSIFKNIELDPQNPKTSKRSKDLIIQIGFSAYKIMRIYLDFESSTRLWQTSEEDEDLANITWLRVAINDVIRRNTQGSEVWERIGDKNNDIPLLTLKSRRKRKINNNRDSKLFEEAFLFFYRNTAHIEILRDNRLYKTYFTILPYCKRLNVALKDQFYRSVNLSSVKSKVSSLLQKSSDLMEEMKHEEVLATYFESTFATKFLSANIQVYKNISLFVCILQNILIVFSNKLFSFTSVGDKSLNQSKSSPEIFIEVCRRTTRTFVRLDLWGYLITDEVDECWCHEQCDSIPGIVKIMRGIGIIQTVMAGLVLVFVFLKTGPILWNRAQRKFLEEEQSYTLRNLFDAKRIIRSFIKWISGTISVFANWDVLYYSIYTSLAAASVVFITDPEKYYLSNFFSAILLLDLIRSSPLLHHIISAIWRPRLAILLALIMFFILLYIFTLVAFRYFPGDYEGACVTLKSCLIRTFDNTFKADGGIGGYLISIKSTDTTTDIKDPESHIVHYGRFVFDNLFNFVLVILMVEMVSGIIIDTFAVLREEDEDRESDKNSYCFICDFDRQTLDRKSDSNKGYAYHVKYEHNLWHYLFFVAYVRDKEETELTGMESYVADQIEKEEVDWFPIERNWDFDKQNEDENEEAIMNRICDHKLITLKESLSTLETRITSAHVEISRIAKKY